MSVNDIKLPLHDFLIKFKNNRNKNHVCLLGAGASKSSGVKTADELIYEWKKGLYFAHNRDEIHRAQELTSDELEQLIQIWCEGNGLPKKGEPIEYQYYVEKVYPDEQDRQTFFTNLFIGKQPSIGYFKLCLLIDFGIIKVIYSTNFDRLINFAAFRSNLNPIDIDLTNAHFLQSEMLNNNCFYSIALHGDYKFSKMKNTKKELDTQNDFFITHLEHKLYDHHCIVMGYSGRDTSLMNALSNAYAKKGPGELFWCIYKNEITQSVIDLIEEITQNGRKAYIIETDGFDETLNDLTPYVFYDEPQYLDKLKNIEKVPESLKGVAYAR